MLDLQTAGAHGTDLSEKKVSSNQNQGKTKQETDQMTNRPATSVAGKKKAVGDGRRTGHSTPDSRETSWHEKGSRAVRKTGQDRLAFLVAL